MHSPDRKAVPQPTVNSGVRADVMHRGPQPKQSHRKPFRLQAAHQFDIDGSHGISKHDDLEVRCASIQCCRSHTSVASFP